MARIFLFICFSFLLDVMNWLINLSTKEMRGKSGECIRVQSIVACFFHQMSHPSNYIKFPLGESEYNVFLINDTPIPRIAGTFAKTAGHVVIIVPTIFLFGPNTFRSRLFIEQIPMWYVRCTNFEGLVVFKAVAYHDYLSVWVMEALKKLEGAILYDKKTRVNL